MKLNRRKVLIGLGGIATGSGALMGSGAFSSVTAERSMEVGLADDANAYLAMMPTDGPNAEYVSTDGGVLSLALDDVNREAKTEFDGLFEVLNQGTQAVGVYFDDGGNDAVTFRSDEGSVETADNAVTLEVGETMTVGLTVDTRGSESFSALDSVSVHADAAVGQQVGDAGTVYVSNTGTADYSTIAGALSAARGGGVETVVVAGDSFDETVELDVPGLTLRGEGATLVGGGFGVGADDVTVTGFTFDGGSESLYGSGGRGLFVRGNTSGHAVVNNTFVGDGDGMGVEFTTGTNITGVRVANNVFRDWKQGVYFNATNEATFENNRFVENGVGIAGFDTDAVATVTGNLFSGNSIEALGVFDADVTLRQNDFNASNAAGVNNYGSTIVDARDNWWGAADGPAGGVSDADSSTTADGSGVVINDGQSGPINFAPFRDEPVTTKHLVDASGAGTFRSVQGALAAARDGDDVEVGAGTYTEQVVVDKSLTIADAGQGESVVRSPDGALPASYTRTKADGSTEEVYPVVLADGVDLTLRDLTVDGARNGTDNRGGSGFAGVGTYNASATLTRVEVTKVTDNTFSGVQHANAVFAHEDDGGDGRTLTIESSYVHDYQKTGILIYTDDTEVSISDTLVEGAGPTDVTAQNGIQLSGATSTLRGNTVTGHEYTPGDYGASGIFAMDETTVVENEVTANDFGVIAYDGAGGTSVADSNVESNDYGLLNYVTTGTIDARNNWWGAPSGPDSSDDDDPVTDADTDAEADGDGDVVFEADGASTHFDPFRTEPLASAGTGQ